MSKRPIPGVAYLFIASTIFAFTSLCVKFASHYFSGLFISMARFTIGAILCTIVLFIKKPHYDWARVRIILIRGFIGALSMISSYLAISLTSPGRASLLSNTYPVFVGIFGALFFHEKLSPRILVSLALCTIGTISVVRDNSGASLAGDVVALGGAVFSGIAVNFVRKASAGGVDPFTIYLSPCTFGLAIFAIFARSEAFGVPEDGMNGIGILLLVLIGTGAFV
ncbi:MAG: DMT family transporter, partial [Spirochaetaceae bacterium]|nr:DMT family transporter [Spirochaetaceae bacterium]